MKVVNPLQMVYCEIIRTGKATLGNTPIFINMLLVCYLLAATDLGYVPVWLLFSLVILQIQSIKMY